MSHPLKPKQISMRSYFRRDQRQDRVIQPINQKPIRFNMALTKSVIIADQLMIASRIRKRSAGSELGQNILQLGEIFSPFLHPFHVLLHLTRKLNPVHPNPLTSLSSRLQRWHKGRTDFCLNARLPVPRRFPKTKGVD